MENRLVTKASCTALFFAISIALSFFSNDLVAQEVDFEKQIAPIFQQRCADCHSEDSQESGLNLESRQNMLVGGDSGIATVVPENPSKSYLLDVVNHVDEDMAMPPDEDKIPQVEIDLLRQWIKEGAKVPGQMQALAKEKSDHWSFQPVVRPAVPQYDSQVDAQAAGPIDAFLLRALKENDLGFSAPADPQSLIRRVSIVLTGLPPKIEEVEEFVSEYKQDAEGAYAALVDRLLASPHFGERWGQHWLDVIRWAESNGSESNMYRKNAWIYRDYVIRAFNEDKRYDRFVFEQIAGDTVGQGDATGFLVAGPHVPSATVGREPTARRQARADRMDEILQTVGASAMGITIGCARCHNHKFDPVSIKDYYEMAAVFEDVEFGGRKPELGETHPRRVRGNELRESLKENRIKLRSSGPWEENWIGYKEIHIPFAKAKAVRFKFDSKFVRIDELEVFGTNDWNENLALATRGTTVEYSEELTKPSMPIERINDGNYGNDAWLARVPQGNKQRPWVQFNFEEANELFRFRLSTNREDFWETDYLLGLNKLNFGQYVVEVQDESGAWTEVASSQKIEKLNQAESDRAKILANIQNLIDQYIDEGPQASFVGRFVAPSKTFVLGRGSPENPRDEVFAAGLEELGGDLGLPPNANGQQRRVAFAKWLIKPENPLTARVAVNRLWSHVFGRGIVATPSDFGAAGAPPTHPELLDWLASELMNPEFAKQQLAGSPGTVKPWSMKRMIRMMVMSRAFRQSSLPNENGMKRDAGSMYLWRFPPKRMEAEVIRDSILLASGKLDRSLGGRSFRIHNVKKRYAQWEVTNNHGPETWRRMIYQERMRRVDDQMFTAFDFPDCGQVRPKRPVSTTPLQALNLMNSDFVLEQAKLVAEKAMADSGDKLESAVERCFELLLGRLPDQQEKAACLELASENNLSLVCRALINSNEFAFLP